MILQEQKARLNYGAIAILTLLPFYYLSYIYHAHRHQSALDDHEKLDRDSFEGEWLNVHIADASDGAALRRLCNNSSITWRPNVVLNLEDANGGIGNVRGNILDFMYFAISSGSSIMLPSFAARSKTDISSLWSGRNTFDTFFDQDFFVSTFAEHCPQMQIYKAETEHEVLEALPNQYTPPSMRTDLDAANTVQHAVSHFIEWLQQNGNASAKVTLVSVGRTLWDGPDTRSLHPKIRSDFGGLLRLHPRVRALAARATYNLARRYNVPLDPTRPYYGKGYMSAHLRTESDDAVAGWLTSMPHANFSAQTETYLSDAVRRQYKVIYVASGSEADIARFGTKAWSRHNVSVTHKHALLDSKEDKAALAELSWDQLALVDYEMLARGAFFAGFVKSSFSYNIAVTRNVIVEREGRPLEELWWVDSPQVEDFRVGGLVRQNVGRRVRDGDKTKAFDDGFSVIWGRDEWHEKKIPRGAWP